MAIETLALVLVGYIAANVATGFFEAPGKELYQKVKSLLTPDEMVTLNLLEKYPDNKDLKGEVATSLETHLNANPDIAQELSELVKQIKDATSRTSFNHQEGETNFNIQNSENSQININKK